MKIDRPIHPAAELFPMLEGDDMKQLAEDIRNNGLLEPVTLHEGQVLDGRNRLVACVIAGVEPRFTEFHENGVSPTQWVISQNLHRRHLTVGQKAMVGNASEPLFAKEAEENLKRGGRPKKGVVNSPHHKKRGPTARDKAAKAVGVGPRAIQDAKMVAREDPEKAKEVAAGKKTLNKAVTELKAEKAEKKFRSPFADGLEKGIPIYEQLGMTEREFKVGMRIRPVIEELAGKLEGVTAAEVANGSTPNQREKLAAELMEVCEFTNELKGLI